MKRRYNTSNKQKVRPPKGTTEYIAALRPYVITLWHGDPFTLFACDKSEAVGIATQRLLKMRMAESFVLAKKLIRHTRVAEKKKTRQRSRPLW